jgi:DNA-binding Lrp family transcriptional regulator
MVLAKRDLLFLCSENSRSRIQEVSRALGKSPQRIKYSIKALQKEGILKDPYTIFDFSYLGQILFRVYFRGGYVSEKDKAAIVDKLKENSYITAVYELNGEFDLVIEMESPNPSRFNKELKKVIELFPTLNNYKIVLNIVTHMYPRSYLVKDSGILSYAPNEIVLGGDRNVQDFSKSEMLIMKNLLMNPRIRLTRLTKESDLNIKTAAKTLKNLQERKVIRGFKSIVDIYKLDAYKFRLFLKLHNVNQQREDDLLNVLLNTKEFIQLNKTVGDWDMEIDLESFEKAKARQLINNLREEFKDLIETFHIMEFYEYYKNTYLPLYLFNQEA